MEPKYKVNPLTGELQEYVFEYNGILALRNFTAKVEDERLILHAADDVNFSILEALVSEVEINGVVYDNPTAAQEALTRLTFNQNRPVLLDKSLKDLILGAVQKIPGKQLTTEDFTTELRTKLEGLQQVDTSGLLPKGTYTGNASSLKADIDKKVDKVAGKGLSSNDYTNEEKRKNEENALKRVANITVTGDVNKIITITFADSTVMQAPFKDNDHIPLADVHMNSLNFNINTGVLTGVKSDGNAITVTLDGRYALTSHNHDERYAAKTHTHSEYAHRTHRHNWDDIDRKPNFNYLPLTGGAINPNKIGLHQEGIRINRASNGWAVIHIGGESDSIKGIKEGEFAIVRNNEGKLIIRTMKDTSLIEALIINTVKAAFGITVTAPLFEANNKIQVGEDGAEATLSNLGLILKNRIRFNAWSGGDGGDISCKGTLQIGSNSGTIHFRKSSQTMSGWEALPSIIFDLNNGVITAYKFVKQGSTGNHILMGDGSHQHIKILGRCSEINSDWEVSENYFGQTINIKKQLNVNLVPLENNYNISFRKCFNGGEVTFTTKGRTVVFTGDNKFNGGDGSTCVVSAVADKLYIDIRNI